MPNCQSQLQTNRHTNRKAPNSAAWILNNHPAPKLSCSMAQDLLPCRLISKSCFMTLEQSVKLIQSCAEQMNARYQKVVFDEWAIIALSDRKGRLLAYIGPRKSGFQNNFLDDAGPLRSGLLASESNVGDFDFARHGVGTGFESFMV